MFVTDLTASHWSAKYHVLEWGNLIDVLVTHAGGSSRMMLSLPPETSFVAGASYSFGNSTTQFFFSSVGGSSCDIERGRVELHEFVLDGSGQLTRLAMDYEQSCDGAQPLQGSIRFNSPRPLRR